MLRDGAREIGWREGDRLAVIGDTQHDIAGGRALGAFVLAVATGWTSLADLASHEPDALLPDLTDLDEVIMARCSGCRRCDEGLHSCLTHKRPRRYVQRC